MSMHAILFDLDNTLIDRDAAFVRFCHEWLDRSQVTLTVALTDGQHEAAWQLMRDRDRAMLSAQQAGSADQPTDDLFLRKPHNLLASRSDRFPLAPALRGEGKGEGMKRGTSRERRNFKANPLTLTLSPQSRGEGTGNAHAAKRQLLDGHPLANLIWSDAWDDEKRQRLPSLIEPQPAVREMLIRLRTRYKLGVITNGSSRVQRAKLEHSGLSDLFDAEHIIVSGEIGIEKPDPAIFDAALARVGSTPDQTLFIGDDPWRDVCGSQRLGMTAIWVSAGRAWDDVMSDEAPRTAWVAGAGASSRSPGVSPNAAPTPATHHTAIDSRRSLREPTPDRRTMLDGMTTLDRPTTLDRGAIHDYRNNECLNAPKSESLEHRPDHIISHVSELEAWLK